MLHGGELYGHTEIQYDFSVNINPLGIPEGVVSRMRESLPLLTRYPDQECHALRQALESFTGIPADRILCGNGASELIEASVGGLGVRSILLTAPSFSGYLHAARAWGAEVRYHTLRREENFHLTRRYLEDLARRPDMAILCSPANPVGNRIDQDLLLDIARICRDQGTWLMVDECFLGFIQDGEETTMRRLLVNRAADREGKEEGAPHIECKELIREELKQEAGSRKDPEDRRQGKGWEKENQRLLVLDAFTKRFAMPGVRLGYLMAARPDILEKIHARQPEWSVSLPAQIAGIAALETGREYMDKARRLIASERKRMAAAMEAMGLHVFPGEANYLFFSSEKELCRPLLDRGILIRSCDNYRGLQKGDYRVAVLKEKENDILLNVMEQILRA